MIPIHKIGGRLGNRMFQLAYIYGQMRRGAIPDIWVQHPEHFDDFREGVLEMFGGGPVHHHPYVSLHVRRGDYVFDPAFVNLSKTDYYERAIAMFPDDKFMVFSDDPAWCKAKWRGQDRFLIMEGGDEIADLNAMAGCKSNIIANSSFSWWGAYLNKRPERVVVYPTQWHSDRVKRVSFPGGWVGL